MLEDNATWYEYLVNRARSNNHFHNPLKPWEEAGLDDVMVVPVPPFVLFPKGQSSLLWSQDSRNQMGFREGDWSLQAVKDHYYLALTSSTDVERQANFARTFRGLGHQMHLLQDAAMPDHVRNHAHPYDALGVRLFGSRRLERWTAENERMVRKILDNPEVLLDSYIPTISPRDPGQLDPSFTQRRLSPIALLFDTDQYRSESPSSFFHGDLATSLEIGLAEYTNANFFSEDTIYLDEDDSPPPRSFFPYPNRSSTNLQAYLDGGLLPVEQYGYDEVIEPRIVISKERDGERIVHFAKPIYWSREVNELPREMLVSMGKQRLLNRLYYLDEACHRDYVAKLIPRAVGYSAAFLNHFFRGAIEISLPSNGVYSVTDSPTRGFRKIRLQAQNVTATSEEMPGGLVALVIKYKTAREDPFQSGPVPTSEEFSYIVAGLPGDANSIPRGVPVELEFDLCPGIDPDDPCPKALSVHATDVYLQLVYRGPLGVEGDAIAVGFKDISEPTPIDIFNNADWICLYGNWYRAGSEEAIRVVDANQNGQADLGEWDVYPHDVQQLYVRFSRPSDPKPASPEHFDYSVDMIPAGEFHRGFVLGDYLNDFHVSEVITKVAIHPGDPWGSMVEGVSRTAKALKRQGGDFPSYLRLRGKDLWGPAGIVIVNREFPPGVTCPLESLP